MKALALVIVLAALLVLGAGEVLGRPAAESAIAQAVADRYSLPQDPSVDIDGFPFLIRTAMGTVPAVTVTLDEYTAERLLIDRFSLRLENVRFRLIRLLRGESDVTAERGVAEAIVRDHDLSTYLGQLGFPVMVTARRGQVTVSASGISATGRLSVSEGQLLFSPDQGPTDVLTFAVPIPAVAGVSLTGIETRDGALALSADVTGYIVPQLNR